MQKTRGSKSLVARLIVDRLAVGFVGQDETRQLALIDRELQSASISERRAAAFQIARGSGPAAAIGIRRSRATLRLLAAGQRRIDPHAARKFGAGARSRARNGRLWKEWLGLAEAYQAPLVTAGRRLAAAYPRTELIV